MSIAQRSQAPAPPWAATRIQAALGLLLFALLLAGFIAYGFRVLLPELLRDNIELIFERYNTLLPDVVNPAMPAWLKVWAVAAVLGALAVSGVYIFQTAASRQSRPGLFWAWLGALAALLEGFDTQREEWERQYAQARSRFEAHRRQIAEARKAESGDAADGGAGGAETSASTHTSGTPDGGGSGGGALASDEALAALRDKLSGGQS